MTRAPTNESTDPGSANPTPPCWVFVPIGDDWAPDLPARAAQEGQLQPARGESQLRSLSEVRLAHLVSPIDSAEPADALDQAIPDWLAGEEGRPVRLVIGQPRRCYPQSLPFGADRHGMQPIDLPTPEAILEGKPDTPAYPVSRYDDDQPRMIPDLAHWYLRHLDGLQLVRRLLARAETGEFGRDITTAAVEPDPTGFTSGPCHITMPSRFRPSMGTNQAGC